MDEEKICEKCKYTLFQSANPVLCEQCAEKFFDTVKDYIKENPDNTIKIVAEETGVDAEYIKKWIKEGRIQFTSPEEAERRKKLEKLKKDYEELLQEEDKKKKTKEEDKPQNKQGRFHTKDR